jgi:endonuclease YncB( thermonuclease family)
MPLTLIQGTFRPATGVPDGDTVRFAPDDPDLLFRLARQGRPPRLNQQNGTIALRYEGIDALERSARQPESSDATDRNLALLGLSGPSDEGRGQVFSRQLDPNGRPIVFVVQGGTDEPDGADVFFDVARLRTTVNYRLLDEGFVYPLFYDTLFADLRQELTQVTQAARSARRRIWQADATRSGVIWGGRASLGSLPPILPKLWRRLDDYTTDREFGSRSETLDAFDEYLQMRNDRLLVLSENRFTGLDNIVTISGNRVALDVDPEDLVFMS